MKDFYTGEDETDMIGDPLVTYYALREGKLVSVPMNQPYMLYIWEPEGCEDGRVDYEDYDLIKELLNCPISVLTEFLQGRRNIIVRALTETLRDIYAEQMKNTMIINGERWVKG